MSSFANEVAKFSNPAPDIDDPEDEINTETNAKITEKTNVDDSGIAQRVSSLRLRNAPLLDEVDERYAGKRISRKSFDGMEDEVSENSDFMDEGESGLKDEHESSDNEESAEIESFKQRMSKQGPGYGRLSSAGMSDELSENELAEDVSGSEDGSEDVDEEIEEDEDDEEEGAEDIMQKFSSTNVSEELEKGKAVQKQQELWSKLCEWRIKLQKLLVIANRLPQYDTWEDFKGKSDKYYSENLNKGQKSVCKLLSNLLDFQNEFLKVIPVSAASTDNAKNLSAEDEEIPSDSEEEVEAPKAADKITTAQKAKKRKLDVEGYEDYLSKQHKTFLPYRDQVIQKWEEKTHLATGHLGAKQNSFNMFDQTALKQINQILQDKPRLIRRTQVKRSAYVVFGKSEPVETSTGEGGEKSHDPLKDCDPEIFDDDDFYRQLLKDVIESKSSMIDPATFSRQLEVQRIRNKIKRKIDTKASKGRKIRFDVHPKMLNLLAPIYSPATEMDEDACNELLSSVFGQRPAALSVAG